MESVGVDFKYGVHNKESIGHPNMVLLLQGISFRSIIYLDLNHNNIPSIEPIAKLKIPSIREIKLSNSFPMQKATLSSTSLLSEKATSHNLLKCPSLISMQPSGTPLERGN